MGHYMTDDEIIARYRTLKPQGRINLLAELNGCACVEIEQVIGRYEMKSKIAGHEDDLRALHASGMTDKEIAAQVGVAPSTIYLWRKNAGLASNAVRGGKREEKHISAEISEKPVEVTEKPAEPKGVTADIKQDLPDDWKNYFASGKDELKQLQAQIKKLERSILFLRGIAIGAGVKDIDKLLEAIT